MTTSEVGASPRDAGSLPDAIETLGTFGSILAIKLYRLTLGATPPVPRLPCLDHEAMLHARIAPHAAAYLQDHQSGDLHEIVMIPSERRVEIDTVSTWAEHRQDSLNRLQAVLRRHFPGYRIGVRGPSRLRGERRAMAACRAQVSLRRVLLDPDLDAVKADIDRLAAIATLMEKQSRVTSWGVRTATPPVLAGTGVLVYQLLGSFEGLLGQAVTTGLRSSLVGLVGAILLYYGLKAVQLTEMANRVWKRSAEYGLIVAERRRLPRAPAGTDGPSHPRAVPS